MTQRLPDGWLPPIARRQSGLFTPAQAVAAGATSHQVRRRRESGRWRHVVGDALALAEVQQTSWLRVQAAGLTWPDAVVCLRAAAAVHGFPVAPPRVVDVIVPNRRPSRGGLRTHRLQLPPGEVSRCGVTLVTTRQRTLFDCLGRLPERESTALLAWTVTRELLDRTALDHAVAERPRWWGSARRRQILADLDDGVLSVAERRLVALLRRAHVTGWATDQRLYLDDRVIARADVLFTAERLVLEVDGYAAHGRDAFQQDRTRQNRIVAAGYTVLRFTWADLTESPDAVVAQVRSTLARLRA